MSTVGNQIARVNVPLFRYLDTVGNGSGTKNATGDYSGAAERFLIAPALDEIFLVEHLILVLEAEATLDNSSFGRFVLPLTNGIFFRVRDLNDTVVTDLTDGVPVKTTFDFAKYGIDARYHAFGEANDQWVVKWDLVDSGQPLILDGRADYRHNLNMELNDDFSSDVVTLSAFVRGRKREWLTRQF